MNTARRKRLARDKDSWHVAMSIRGGWAVRRHGNTRATRVFPTKGEAINMARWCMLWRSSDNGRLYIHGKAGWIQHCWTPWQALAPFR